MTTSSGVLLSIILLGVIVLIVVVIAQRKRPAPLDHEAIFEQTREVAREVARSAAQSAAQEAGDAAIRAYQGQQDALRQEESTKRREAAAKAKATRATRIEALQQWRETFVTFVKGLGEPFFAEWDLDRSLLDEWAEERADVYIQRKPYVLEIIQSIHADAQRAAEALANKAQKSGREIARERARSIGGALVRNIDCPYCGTRLDDKAHLEHIIPVQRGGPSASWNMVYVCIPCNRAKHDLSLMEFLDSEYARRKGLKASEIAKRLKELQKYIDVLR